MSAPDIFALARADDAELLSLFQEWVEAEREAARYGSENPKDEDGFNLLTDANAELARRIAALPATGTVGLAIKAYLFAFWEYEGSVHDAAAIAGLYDDGCVSTQILRSLMRDLPAFVPEIAPLIRFAGDES